MDDAVSPLTSVQESEMGSERPPRAGSDTSQQSEGSLIKTTKRQKLESDDEYNDDDMNVNEAQQESQEQQSQRDTSATSTQKRKRKSSRAALSDEEDDIEMHSVSALETEAHTSTASSSNRRSTTILSKSKKHSRVSDHTIHSDNDDLPFKASLGNVLTRRTSSRVASQERELRALQVAGNWGGADQSNNWSVRPKRNAAKKFPSFELLDLGLDGNGTEELEDSAGPAHILKDKSKRVQSKARSDRAPSMSSRGIEHNGEGKVKEEAGQPVKVKPRRGRPPWKNIVKVEKVINDTIGMNERPNSALGSRPRKPFKAKAANDMGSDIEVIDADHLAQEDSNSATTSAYVHKPGRTKREAAKRVTSYFVPHPDENGSSLEDSDGPTVMPSPRSKKSCKSKAKVVTSKDAMGEFEPSSTDSIFDANALVFTEDEESAKQDLSRHGGQEVASSSALKKANNAEYDLIKRDDKTYLPQYKNCQRTPNFQPCRYCVARQAGDSCRFVGLRALPVRLEDAGIRLLTHYSREEGPIFIDDVTLNEKVVLPDHYDLNRPMDDNIKVKIMTTTAISLVGILKEGLEHARKPGCIRRARELQIRAMCDFCSTGLFSASYLCRRCGGEYCLPCKAAMDLAAKGADSQLYSCVKDKLGNNKTRIGNRHLHTSKLMFPVSRFSVQELQEELAAMEKVIEENAGNIRTSMMLPEGERPETLSTMQPSDVTEGILPSHPVVVMRKRSMDEAQFLSTWAKGEPLVVTDVRTKKEWDPNAFIEKYGSMNCDIVRCDEHAPFMLKERVMSTLKTDPTFFRKWEKQVKVHQFFETFGKADEERAAIFGKGIWKLKDWPPAAEFETAFPDIYEDFNYAVPMPDFTRRDGCNNISSLFPKNANGPDLGPKMYNAWPGEHTKGKKGTTCLHMDIADAINILLYTAKRSGTEEAAQWDIFRAEDANAIRDFLRGRHPEILEKGDPIHAQEHYLDDEALQDLYKEKGVYSWRIMQRAGQAVFIPAGCAHQVCNLTDCIKVAVDFISPQNVARCFQLTEEFRGLSLEGRKSWKEDVLQLKAQLWYAWKACRALRPIPTEEEFESVKFMRALKKRKQQEAMQEDEERRANLRALRHSNSKKQLDINRAVATASPSIEADTHESREGAEPPVAGGTNLLFKSGTTVKLEEVESTTSTLSDVDEHTALEVIAVESLAGESVVENAASTESGVAKEKISEVAEEGPMADRLVVEEVSVAQTPAKEDVPQDRAAREPTFDDVGAVVISVDEATTIEGTFVNVGLSARPDQGSSDPTEEHYESAEESHGSVMKATESAGIKMEISTAPSLTIAEDQWEPRTPPRPCSPPQISTIVNLLNPAPPWVCHL